MPIYEFYCEECHAVFNFFSSRINTDKRPACPECGRPELQKHLSSFAVVGRAREDSDANLPDIDEEKLERLMGELARESESISEDDPRRAADLMRRAAEKSGLPLNEAMREALARMEAGEDPDKVEAEMGDLLDNGDPFGFEKNPAKGKRARAPRQVGKLYEL